MKNGIKIDLDVPLPNPRTAANPTLDKAASQMTVGASIFFETNREAQQLARALLRRNRKYAVRKVDGGFRCWRLA
jgi:hypothetical protein